METLFRSFTPGAKLLILSNDGGTPAQVAQMLTANGFGSARLAVLEHMGGAAERRVEGLAGEWHHPRGADLNVLAVDCGPAEPQARSYSILSGLPDEAYE
ncbi:hypothetical protein NY536_16920, partial [Enterobacter hormaechei]|nr:hypothetical protein [Enterobacter hormaechei]